MIEFVLLVVYITVRNRYEPIKVFPYFMELFFVLLTVSFIAMGNHKAAETMGSLVYLFFTLTVAELFLTKYRDARNIKNENEI